MLIGDEHTVKASATILANNDQPCRLLTIRLESGAAGDVMFGNSDVTSGANRHGFLAAGESWTFGPYTFGSGIRPSEIYVVGTADDLLFWNGLTA